MGDCLFRAICRPPRERTLGGFLRGKADCFCIINTIVSGRLAGGLGSRQLYFACKWMVRPAGSDCFFRKAVENCKECGVKPQKGGRVFHKVFLFNGGKLCGNSGKPFKNPLQTPIYSRRKKTVVRSEENPQKQGSPCGREGKLVGIRWKSG